jgi:hypothetical protein
MKGSGRGITYGTVSAVFWVIEGDQDNFNLSSIQYQYSVPRFEQDTLILNSVPSGSWMSWIPCTDGECKQAKYYCCPRSWPQNSEEQTTLLHLAS